MTNDGKFILDGKRVKFSDYGGSSKEANMPLKEIDRDVEVLTASALLSRLWHIEADIKYMKESIENLDDSYHDIDTRFDELEDSKKIEKNAEVMPTALVKWEELYTRLWNIESRLDKLEEKNDATD